MKAHQLLLEDVIEVNPRTGVIKINDKRMVLMSVEALGILRRDLVNTLSMERAKGFLMRYGWACGMKAAEDLEKRYDWESTEELMLAGPAFHTLEGIVTVEPDELKVDQDSLYFTGFWRNSYEVEEHINHYGESDDPVCWTLVGYASGYLTKTFGKQVFVYEDQCRGKGDHHCYFVAKTVDPYDHPPEDLRYYDADSLLSELDRSYKEIKELNRNIIESENVQKKLTDLLLADKSLSIMVEVVSSFLQKSIIIDYWYGENEGVFLNEEDAHLYENWLESPEDFVDNQKIIETYPIHAKGKDLGDMIVISDKKMNKKEKLIIQRSLTILSIKIFHQFHLMQLQWRKKEDFFKELVSGEKDEDTLQMGNHIFEFDPKEMNRVVTISLKTSDNNERVLEYLNSSYPSLDIFLMHKKIVVILPESKEKDLEGHLTDLQSSIETKFTGSQIYIGVGRRAKGLKTLAKSYQDATCICDFTQLVYPSESCISYFEDLEPVILLLKGTDQEELMEFCRNMVGELVAYDKENQNNLLATLKSYLDNNGNLQQTADHLHLSVAGLRYRLQRIESLCEGDLKSGKGRFKYQLAISIYFAMQVIDHRSHSSVT